MRFKFPFVRRKTVERLRERMEAERKTHAAKERHLLGELASRQRQLQNVTEHAELLRNEVQTLSHAIAPGGISIPEVRAHRRDEFDISSLKERVYYRVDIPSMSMALTLDKWQLAAIPNARAYAINRLVAGFSDALSKKLGEQLPSDPTT